MDLLWNCNQLHVRIMSFSIMRFKPLRNNVSYDLKILIGPFFLPGSIIFFACDKQLVIP